MEGYILIIEDDVLVAENISFLLNQEGFTRICVADNLKDCESLMKKKQISLIISDINLHGVHEGPGIVKHLQTQSYIPVIYLTAYSEEQILEEALATSPVAYVIKPFTDRQLMVAVQIAVKQIAENVQPGKSERPSARELQVIEQVAKGLSNKEIADLLFLSEHTIKAHRRNLIRKYQLRSSSELIAMSIRLKWININKLN